MKYIIVYNDIPSPRFFASHQEAEEMAVWACRTFDFDIQQFTVLPVGYGHEVPAEEPSPQRDDRFHEQAPAALDPEADEEPVRADDAGAMADNAPAEPTDDEEDEDDEGRNYIETEVDNYGVSHRRKSIRIKMDTTMPQGHVMATIRRIHQHDDLWRIAACRELPTIEEKFDSPEEAIDHLSMLLTEKEKAYNK